MSKLVMVIDDSPTVIKIVETCLKREAYTVISFRNGVEALRWIRWVRVSEGTFPDIIFLDVKMPFMDGFAVAQQLRRQPQLAQVPILMLTRCDSVIDRLKARLVGASELIGKPFKTQHLVETVQKYVGVAEPVVADYSCMYRSSPLGEELQYDRPRSH